MEKLKPCPFCGGKAEIVFVPATGFYLDSYYVCCKGCGVSTVRTARNRYDAAAKWNRRAEK